MERVMLGFRVPELAADEDDVAALRDQERGERVSQVVEKTRFDGPDDQLVLVVRHTEQ